MEWVEAAVWGGQMVLLLAALLGLAAAAVAFAPAPMLHEEDCSGAAGAVPFDPVWPLLRAMVSPLKSFVYDPVAAGEDLPLLQRTFTGVKVQAELVAGLHALRRKSCAESSSGQAVSSTPLFYLEVVSFAQFIVMMANPFFPFPLLGSVHARTRITQACPIPASTELHLHTAIGGSRPHRRGTEVDFIAEARVAGEDAPPVWSNTTTVLFFHRRNDAVDRSAAYEPLHRADAVWDEGVPLAADTGFVYAALCQDYNPIHLYAWSARLFGFRSAIVHGMCLLEKSLPALLDASAALAEVPPGLLGVPLQAAVEEACMSGLVHASPEARTRLLNGAPAAYPIALSVSFRKPVFLPSTPRVQAHPGKAVDGQALVEEWNSDATGGWTAFQGGPCLAYEVRDGKDSVCLYGTLVTGQPGK